jgi:hypothetical protein
MVTAPEYRHVPTGTLAILFVATIASEQKIG